MLQFGGFLSTLLSCGLPCGKFDAFPRARLCVCVRVIPKWAWWTKKKIEKKFGDWFVIEEFSFAFGSRFWRRRRRWVRRCTHNALCAQNSPIFFFGSSYRVSGHIMYSSTHMRRTHWRLFRWKMMLASSTMGAPYTIFGFLRDLWQHNDEVVIFGCLCGAGVNQYFIADNFHWLRGGARGVLLSILLLFFFAFHACRCARQNLKLNWQLALSHE